MVADGRLAARTRHGRPAGSPAAACWRWAQPTRRSRSSIPMTMTTGWSSHSVDLTPHDQGRDRRASACFRRARSHPAYHAPQRRASARFTARGFSSGLRCRPRRDDDQARAGDGFGRASPFRRRGNLVRFAGDHQAGNADLGQQRPAVWPVAHCFQVADEALRRIRLP